MNPIGMVMLAEERKLRNIERKDLLVTKRKQLVCLHLQSVLYFKIVVQLFVHGESLK